MIAALATACASSDTSTDVARAMCAKNIGCHNLTESLDDCTARVAATMPPASCSAADLETCERAIDDEACRSPETALPIECGACE